MEEDILNEAGESLYGNKKGFNGGKLLNVLIALFLVILAIEIVFNSVFTGIYVVNISMQPTLHGAASENVSGGDFIYVNRLASPNRGDIVVVYRETQNPDGTVEKGNIIKRAVAFGGDTVEMVRGVLYVNGEEFDDKYAVYTPYNEVNTFASHTVEENCMFLLGDNRDKSTDSRANGDYPMKNLVGVVPQWSVNAKEFTTAIYTFFNFTIHGK